MRIQQKEWENEGKSSHSSKIRINFSNVHMLNLNLNRKDKDTSVIVHQKEREHLTTWSCLPLTLCIEEFPFYTFLGTRGSWRYLHFILEENQKERNEGQKQVVTLVKPTQSSRLLLLLSSPHPARGV